MCQEGSVKIVMLSVIFEWHSKDLLCGQNNEDSLLLFPCIYIPCTVHVYAKLFQSCPTLWDPMDCSLPGSLVHGILQAKILEWVAIPFSGMSLTQGSSLHLLGLLHWQAGSLPLVLNGKPLRDLSQQ